MTRSRPRSRCFVHRHLWPLPIAFVVAIETFAAAAGPKLVFDIPAGGAEAALQAFVEQARVELVYNVAKIDGIKTNPVKGQMTAGEALDRLVANTGLVIVKHEKTGAVIVDRAPATAAAKPPSPSVKKNETEIPQTQDPMKRNMKRKNPIAIVAGWLALALAPVSLADAADSDAAALAHSAGVIEGRVLNPRTGEYLEKARVTIEGTTLETFTDAGGYYRISNVPAGSARVKVFFTGLDPLTEEVGVPSEGRVQRDFSLTSEIVKLSEFVVTSSKEMDGSAIAINEQRFASNIVNVVSADEFGSVLENNPGDFLKRLPGITIDFIGGAAQSISMGGVPSEYVPITVGGFDVSSVAGGGTGRRIDFHTISMNNISRLEVLHSPTPESPGNALAGSVNMIPRSAFDRARPVFNYSVFMMMRDNDRHLFSKTPGPRWTHKRKVHPGFEFSYSKPVNDRFGFTLTGANTKQYTEEAASTNVWRGGGSPTNGITAATAATQYPDTTPDQPYLTDYTVQDAGKTTMRTSAGATIDYRISPNDRVSLSLELTYFDSPLNQRNLSFFVNRVSPGDFGPTWTHGQPGRGEVRQTSQSRHHYRMKYMPTLRYWHNGPVWKAESGFGYSAERLHFRSSDLGYFNQVVSRRRGVTVSFDDIFYLQPGRITVTDAGGAPVDPYVLDDYALSTTNATVDRTKDTKRSAYANLRRSFDLGGLPLVLKGGVDVRESIRDHRRTTPSYTFVGPAGGSASLAYDDVFSQRVAPYGFPKIEYTSTQNTFNLFKDNPGWFQLNENSLYRSVVTSSKNASEIVSSAYLRGDLALLDRRLKLVGGIRAEQTNIEALGALTDPTRNFQRDASGAVIRNPNGTPVLLVPTSNALGVSQLTFIERGLRAEKEYLRWFPSLNASYNVRENLIARAAYYTSVGRPNFNQYAGALTLPDPDRAPGSSNRITVNNAGIKAWSAQTAKVRLEYYFEGVGQISVGGFRREFENFFGATIFPATPEFLALYGIDPDLYGDFDVSTQHNITGTVRMTGLEFDYKQALTMLPHWARGVQVYANATALRATGDSTANFAGFVPRSYNWGVSLSRERYNLRAKWNYRGRARLGAVSGRSIEPGTFHWASKFMFLDIEAEYYLRKRFAVFANLRNVGDATNDRQVFGPGTPEHAQFRQRTTYGSLWSFGVKGSF